MTKESEQKNPVIIVILVILVISSLLYGYNNYSEFATNLEKEEAGKEVILVSASDLYKEYKNNEIWANKQYKDNIVEVTGKITDIYEIFGSSNITISSWINCVLEKWEESKASLLNKGKQITIKGKVIWFTVGSVSIIKCKIK